MIFNSLCRKKRQRLFLCIVFFKLICYTKSMYNWGGSILDTQRITAQLLDWYASHYRPLPWRNNPTPYHVWVSEIMLQQTRIEAVLPYFHRFVDTLPTIADLAQASTEVLLKLWEGLGYYSRVRHMQKAAQTVMREYNGELPADYDALLSLSGIGPYTAGAIASIAFDIPVPAVDGNVMRVLARLTADDTDVLSNEGKKRFTALAWDLVPESGAGRFNQALMELGETICTPNGDPRCSLCPLREDCAAHRLGCAQQLPVRIKKTARRVELRQIALVRIERQPPAVLLHKREPNGLLADLWELPNTLSGDPLESVPWELRGGCVKLADLPMGKHLFSHIEWRMQGALYALDGVDSLPDGYAVADWSMLQTAFPLPSAFRTYTDLLPQILSEES